MTDGTLVVHCPGFGKTQADCEPLFELYEKVGLSIQVVLPQWRDSPRRRPSNGSLVLWDGTMSYALAMIDVALVHSRPGQKVLLTGHSTGAVIAMIAASMMEHMVWPPQRDTRLAVYSIAAYPQRKIHSIYRNNPDSDSRNMSGRQRQDFGRVQIVPLSSPTLAFCGSQEKRYTQDMMITLLRNCLQAEGFVVDGAHNLNHPKYLRRIRRELTELLDADREIPLLNHPLPPPHIAKAFQNTILLSDHAPNWFQLIEVPKSSKARPDADLA